MGRSVVEAQLDREMEDVGVLVRRVVGARLHDSHTIEDVVQETLARVLTARPRLSGEAVAPYAIVTARNVIASLARNADRERRNLHLLVEIRDVPGPEDGVVEQEEREAVSAALGQLSEQDRDAVLAHEVFGVDTSTLAREHDSTPGGVAMRLSRSRARLRVEYLVALRGKEPPTLRCRPVLVALSAGDTRRQRRLDAGAHLVDCDYCGAVSASLMERRRSLAALLPLAALGKLGEWMRRVWEYKATKVAAATGTLIAGGVAYGALSGDAQRLPDAQGPTSQERASCEQDDNIFIAGGKELRHWDSGRTLRRVRGETIRACRVRVMAVPADEGFWAGDGSKRVWVQFDVPGESKRHIQSGQRLSFRGRVVEHGPGFARRLERDEGVRELRLQGHHLEVSVADLEIEPRP